MPVNLQGKIPTTLDEAVDIIYNGLDADEIKYFQENGVVGLHFGAGMAIRNEWGLWHDSELAKWFNNIGLGHADDMSGIILDNVCAKVKGEVFDLDGEIKRYKEYWLSKNIDPLTQKEI